MPGRYRFVSDRRTILSATALVLAAAFTLSSRQPADTVIRVSSALMSQDKSPAAVMMQQSMNRPAPPASADTAATAELVAAGTGGLALSLSEALPGQLAAIVREQDEYYRLSYTPPPAAEGTCHTLRVAVSGRALITRARNQYCAEKAVDLVAGKIEDEGLESRAGGGTGSLDLKMRLPYFYTATNRASVYLSLEAVPVGMKFEKTKTGFHGQLDLVGITRRPDGAVAERFADTLDIDRDTRQLADEFARTPYHYEHQFTLAPGTYTFQLSAGAGPNAVGKTEVPLTVEPWNSLSFGMGGIALSTETRPVDTELGSDALDPEGSTPLIAGGKQFMPAAANRFRKADRVFFYTEVYEPTLAGPDPSTLKMQVRVLDRKTEVVKVDTGMIGIAGYVHPGNPVVPFTTALPVAPLPPGRYRLEVKASHSSGPEVLTRSAGFEVSP